MLLKNQQQKHTGIRTRCFKNTSVNTKKSNRNRDILSVKDSTTNYPRTLSSTLVPCHDIMSISTNLKVPLVTDPRIAASSPPRPISYAYAPMDVPPTRNIHVGSPRVKVDVQTTRRSSVNRPKYFKVN